MVSLLNEARRQAGKPQLGCLNPFLYANAVAFTDVTRGTNAIDRSHERGCALPAGPGTLPPKGGTLPRD